jgi:hypothetical protein
MHSTQNDLVLSHMLRYRSITQKDAQQYGIMRLASRILELKRRGYKIHTVTCREWSEDRGRFVPFARYMLDASELQRAGKLDELTAAIEEIR